MTIEDRIIPVVLDDTRREHVHPFFHHLLNLDVGSDNSSAEEIGAATRSKG
jgi:hypothetical protein